jgi:3-oxoacyl-[acyl-carrier protein] reductase
LKGICVDLELKDNVCIVSGSSRGIGQGIARVLLEEGARVALTGRDEQSLSSAFTELGARYPGRVLSHAGDLNSDDILDTLVDRVLGEWGGVHGIVANAGAVRPVPEWDVAEEDWRWYFDANFTVAVRFVTRFVPRLVESRGSVVFIGSIAGVEDIGAPLPYSASKMAVAMYSKGLARQLAPKGVRVNTIAPGNVIFPGGNWDTKRQADPDGIAGLLEQKVPLNRFGTPEEIGHAAAFLLSGKASFITGSCLVVDGGQTNMVT